MIPSLDAHLVNELGFRPDVRRLPITGLGCVGGAAALARAHDFLVGFPEARALVVAVELPSLSMQRADLSLANLVSTAIFGDGAAAALLDGGAVGQGTSGVRILETLAHIFPESTWALGFDLQDDGFHSVLSKDVPMLLKSEIARLVRVLAQRRGLSRDELSCFVLHPGGRKILAFAEEELGLRRDDTQPSWDVLRGFGNQSSASVLFVLHEWLTKRQPAAGAHGILAAFGPGLSTEMLLLKWS
jgi:alkylresorcinol/alkylpyrone synthase